MTFQLPPTPKEGTLKHVLVTLNCCLCSESFTSGITIDGDWGAHGDEDTIEIERDWTCPRHPGVSDWRAHNCVGCVGSWGSCDLWGSFAYERRVTIGRPQLEQISQGSCPSRTNGTFTTSRSAQGVTFGELDLRAPEAPLAAQFGGKSLAASIVEYTRRYFPDLKIEGVDN